MEVIKLLREEKSRLETELKKVSQALKILEPEQRELPTIHRIRHKKRIKHVYWEPADTEKLLELKKDGVSLEKIAKILNRPYSSIYARLYRLRAVKPSYPHRSSRHKWTKEEDNMLEGMWNNGYLLRNIAHRLNLTQRQISVRKKQLGITERIN